MKAVSIALLSLACLAPLAASAQWQWLDKDGRKVFSDQAPPPEIPAHRILKQPGQRAAAPAAQPNDAAVASTGGGAAASAKPPAGVDPALKPAGKDKALEEKRKQAEVAEAEKRKAEEARVAAARTENCNRAQAARTSYESGMRIATVNAQGEREVMDDERRAAELKRLNEIIGRDCRNDRQ